MSANLTSEMGVIDRIVILINECKKMKIQVKSPDINVSFEDFRPINKSTISYGMNAIKNVGSKALETIINDRSENGRFESIFDLCSRIDQQKVNKRVLERRIYEQRSFKKNSRYIRRDTAAGKARHGTNEKNK